MRALENHDGITLSGGDPFFQPEACYEIAKYAKKLGLNIWCYTGFTSVSYTHLDVYKRQRQK